MNDEKWMSQAFQLAKKAKQHGEVPVGAVIIHDGNLIGEGFNQSIYSNDPSAHAEIIALRDAGNKINNYRLCGAVMYVTLEPCLMCVGAMLHARIARLVYAVSDYKTGACGSVFNFLQERRLNHQIELGAMVMENECLTLIQDFFKEKRTKRQ